MSRFLPSSITSLLPALCLIAGLLTAGPVQAREVEGFNLPDTLQLGGQSLKLVGAGVRTKWFVNVYVMGVYQKTAKAAAGHLINSDEPKYLWLHMMRGIGGGKMRDAIDDGLAANASDDARGRIAPGVDKLKAKFPGKIKKGLDIGFWYRPGKGTTLRLGGKDKLTVAGKEFMVSLWSIWFGRRPADKGLKKSVISG